MDRGTNQKEYLSHRPSGISPVWLGSLVKKINLVCARPSKLSQVWSPALCLHGSILSRYLVAERLVVLEQTGVSSRSIDCILVAELH